MAIRKGITTILSAGALAVSVASAHSEVAKKSGPVVPKVEFDANGRVGVSDKELLDRLGVQPNGGGVARFDLRIPNEIPVEGPKVNSMCSCAPHSK